MHCLTVILLSKYKTYLSCVDSIIQCKGYWWEAADNMSISEDDHEKLDVGSKEIIE